MKSINNLTTELFHHGIKGQKWGVRRFQPYPKSYKGEGKYVGIKSKPNILTQDEKLAIRNLRNSRTSNLDKFGKDRDNNVVFIAGYSGSGKSTTALGLARKNDKVIHLDSYSDPGMDDLHSKDFDEYLKQNGVDIDKIKYREMKKIGAEAYWKNVDNFREAIEKFSKEQYDKGNRVIVEGVQIGDDWLSDNMKWYVSKPMIIMGTSADKSYEQAANRDEIDFTKQTKEWFEERERVKRSMHKRLNTLAKETNSIKNGKDYVYMIIQKSSSVNQ